MVILMPNLLIAMAKAKTTPILLLAHGAGAPMDSPFLESFAARIIARGVSVARFEFDYMAQRRHGRRKPPPRAEALMGEYAAAIAEVRTRHPKSAIWIGGKSLGGRVASMVAAAQFAAENISGCVCLGYPFHPPKQPDKLRTAHLEALECPTLIVQGERDPFGTRPEVEGYALSDSIQIAWIGDGDHDLKPRAKSGRTVGANLDAAADAVADFVTSRRR